MFTTICLENFELRLEGLSSALLIGANGSGKSTVAQSLKVLQQIALGKNGLGDLIRPLDFTQHRTGLVPSRETRV